MKSQEECKSSISHAMNSIYQILDAHVGKDDPDLLMRYIIANLVLYSKKDMRDLRSTSLEWATDIYTSEIIGNLWPDLMKLHKFLVERNATPDTPYDFGYCDRYGVAFANEKEWKSMAFQTQNYTYMVVLERRDTYRRNNEKAENWCIHIRVCTKNMHGMDKERVEFQKIEFLNSKNIVHPEIGYSNKANEYFRYKDGRDRGYICTVKPSFLYDTGIESYETKDVIHSYGHLSYILYDLTSHCSMLEENSNTMSGGYG